MTAPTDPDPGTESAAAHPASGPYAAVSIRRAIPSTMPSATVGKVTHRFDVGDHVGHLLGPVAGSAPDELGELLTFSDVRDVDPGHDP